MITLQRLLSVGLLVALLQGGAASAVPDEEYAARRAKVLQLLDSTGAMLLGSSDFKVRSNDVAYRFRQDNNLLYLTGIEEPGVFLLLSLRDISVDGSATKALLFVPKDAMSRLKPSPALRGTLVLESTRLQEILAILLPGTRTLYLSTPDIRFLNDWVNERAIFMDRDVRKELENRFPGLKVKSPGALLGGLRGVKSEAEVELICDAIRMTGDGVRKAMELCKPGMYEYELQAAIEYEMIRQGSVSPAYPSIVGSGTNSLIPHYDDNHRKMEEGDLVVMDVGAEYDNYSADITRTIPISGRFTPEQLKMYLAVLKAQDEIIAAIRPGLPWSELDRVAKKVLADEGFPGYLNHGVSHHLGLDTHDAGPWDTLRVGMVITVEPGLYVPVKDTVLSVGYRGHGVRIEDDVLVTEKGGKVLSEAIPRSPDDIEALMKH
jgi:Xaa-Pro aminopeptidase